MSSDLAALIAERDALRAALRVVRDALESRRTRVNMPDGTAMANYIRLAIVNVKP